MTTPPLPIPSELPDVAPRSLAGTIVGPYQILLELASGGMATVYLARAQDGRAAEPLVAIKRPHRHLVSDKNFVAMLLDEARLASAIAHPNVVKVRELRFDDGEPSIVMEYVEGASLSELWKDLAADDRAFDLRVALRIVLDGLAGMHAAHELTDASGKPLGIVHRDISPHNVLVGSDGRARLTDFGIAHAADRFQETRTQEVKGKLAYLAPERVDRRRICTRQSDVFSMAVVLWECVAGRRLFRGEEAVDTLQEVMHLPIPRLRQVGCELPSGLDDVIARALSRDLEVRFATALELATALEAAAGPGAIATPEQVARLVEAIRGPRLAARHEEVRRVVADDAAMEQLFADAGVALRRPGAGVPDPSSAETLEAMAPHAPSERYVFGAVAKVRFFDERPSRWMLAGGIAAGLVLGAAGTVVFAQRDPEGGRVPAPSAVASGLASAPPAANAAPSALASASPHPGAWTRHIVVELPFLASHIAMDGVGRDLMPAADTVPLDVPASSDARHHVVAIALDGSLAESDVVELGGVARAVAGGFRLVPRPPVAAPRAATAPPAAAAPGIVKNGFTKLK